MGEAVMVSREECEREGKVWVSMYRKRDRTLIHGFCRGKNTFEAMKKKQKRWEKLSEKKDEGIIWNDDPVYNLFFPDKER